MEVKIEEVQMEAVPNQFWGAVKIFTEKPHVINRRICGTVNLWIGVCEEDFNREELTKSLIETIESNCCDTQNSDQNVKISDCSDIQISLIQKKLEDYCFKSLSLCDNFKSKDDHDVLEIKESDTGSESQHDNISACQETKWSIPWEYLAKASSNSVAVIRKILPKQVDKFAAAAEVILLDGGRKRASYMTETKSAQPSITPKVNYSISLSATEICISYFKEDKQEGEASVLWLKKNVLPKVVKWATEVSEDGHVEDRGSLRLIDVAEYNEVYQRLKVKYGKPLVKMWPEVTDPLKFVYEDISIAAYLILLWKQERQKKGLSSLQTFVDLGCGNGLLVYILSGEGHKGLGIDLKKRKIWDLFPSHVNLKIDAIEPSDKNLFPDYDWLIGNHSDELTPWIPVMAAKSGCNTRFFVIPCCAHDFSQKYRRRHAGRSQYSDYLEYVQEVGAVCGFEVKQDKLRIPSTKRICIVGEERINESEYSNISERIDSFIKERTNIIQQSPDGTNEKGNSVVGEGNSVSNSMWTDNFKARESVQPVRNCTQLKRSIREDIISAIAGVLLEKKHLVEVDVGDDVSVTWDRGGSIALGDLARRLDRHLLAAMKKECGGLQTLLKNYRYIFNISNGEVSLQVPEPAWKKTASNFMKTKLCWFHENHGSGCPLPADVCMFAHGEEDMRCKGNS
uniref:tRNA (uracil-O(2)-)-methyltransferase n=1 Tax=Scylla olivacea TaxID=85551 RepID=A0A0P4VVC2_SCYOL